MLRIAETHLAIIKNILHLEIPDGEVRAFGSRLTEEARPYSDLDLVIISKKKLERKTMIRLKEAFEESSLPFRVDLLDWHRLSDNFKKIIQKKYLVIQPPAN
jgi:predicted nucleotidyltransferase